MELHAPSPALLAQWKQVQQAYLPFLKPNRKTGAQLVSYLMQKYVLTEFSDRNALDAITYNVTMNAPNAEKLPQGTRPQPKAFFVENQGNSVVFIKPKT